jgi:hypothetical protein
MDRIDLSSRMPIGQLMRRAVTYTYQAGADGSTAPLPSIKKILVIFGSPLPRNFDMVSVQEKLFGKYDFHSGSLL